MQPLPPTASNLCQHQSEAAANLPPAALPALVYHRVAEQIANTAPLAPPTILDTLRFWLPRIGATALGLLVLTITLVWKFDRSPTQPPSPAIAPSSAASTVPRSIPVPSDCSLGFYRNTVVRSLDDLDQLVNQQAERVEGFASTFPLRLDLLD